MTPPARQLVRRDNVRSERSVKMKAALRKFNTEPANGFIQFMVPVRRPGHAALLKHRLRGQQVEETVQQNRLVHLAHRGRLDVVNLHDTHQRT